MDLRRKLVWITVVYFAQGFPFGIAYKVWPVYFRSHGVSLAEIGLMSLLFLPYTLKTAWAPLVDRFGSRQSWVIGAGLALAGITLAAATLDPSRSSAALWITLLAFTVASATQDVAIDGYAVDIANDRDRGPINGVRVSAYRVAMVAAGGLLLVLADHLGWRPVWQGTALLFVVLAAAVAASPRVPRERTGRAVRRPSPRLLYYRAAFSAATGLALGWGLLGSWPPLAVALSAIAATLTLASFLEPELLAWVARREMLPVVLFAFFYKLGDNSLGRMVEPFWIDKGLSPQEIGLVSTTLGTVLVLVGALLGGWFIARRGIFSGLVWFGLAQAVSNFGYVAVAAFDLPRQSIYGASMIESLTQGLGTAAFLSFFMALCDREHGATQFALLTATFALSRDLLGALSGFGAQTLGYAVYFTVTALLAVPGLLLLPFIRRRIPGDAGGRPSLIELQGD